MRITSIELAGTPTRNGQGMPRAFAHIGRMKADPKYIEVTIVTPGNERTHHVQTDCEDDLWSMAECLQFTLDGVRGTNSAIDEYYRQLQGLAE